MGIWIPPNLHLLMKLRNTIFQPVPNIGFILILRFILNLIQIRKLLDLLEIVEGNVLVVGVGLLGAIIIFQLWVSVVEVRFKVV